MRLGQLRPLGDNLGSSLDGVCIEVRARAETTTSNSTIGETGGT